MSPSLVDINIDFSQSPILSFFTSGMSPGGGAALRVSILVISLKNTVERLSAMGMGRERGKGSRQDG